jgi:carboxyl-terminal processing protease
MNNRLIIVLFLFLASLGINAQAQTAQDKMNKFLEILDKHYVKEVNKDSLVEAAIKRMLKELDPHSIYYSAEDLKKVDEPLKGNFEGVGIQFNIYKDTILVVETIAGGPSESVGIMSGDKIIFIDALSVAGIGIKNNDVIGKLRGTKGTKVDVSVLRKGEQNLLDFTITRDKIPIYAVDASYMADDDVGYIKLARFSSSSTREVVEAIYKLKEQGMKHLIFDLTGNTGGYLNQAFEMANQFLEADKLIVYTEGRSNPRENKISNAGGVFKKGNLVIMVDQRSASASEIVAGAIQDWDRGIILGRRTYGKGLVQKPFTLPDMSAVRLTIANYYTPSGRFIQKPYSKGDSDYYKEVSKRFEEGELMDEEKIKMTDTVKYKTSKGRIVYGGGGIIPDIFVGVDTTQNSKFYSKLFRRGVFNNFGIEYIDQKRESLMKKYPNVDAYIEKFKIEDIWEEFLEYAEKKEVTPDEGEDYSNSIPLIQTQIKSILARNLYKSDAMYKIFNLSNPIYLKALEVIKDKKTYNKLGIVD